MLVTHRLQSSDEIHSDPGNAASYGQSVFAIKMFPIVKSSGSEMF